jgi:hypothetical protein
MGSREKQLGSKRRKPDIRAERIVKPSADIVAGRTAPMNDLVVATAPTKIAGPAAATGLLSVDIAFPKPSLLPFPVDAMVDMPHGAGLVIDEAMTRK